MVAVAQIVPPTDLGPEIVDFCLRFHIAPTVREYYNDENNNDPHLCVSNQSSDIEEISELKKFSEALRNAQVAILKTINKNKRGKYSKRSKKTLRHQNEVCIRMASKGFLPLDKFLSFKGNYKKQNELTLELDNINNIICNESEKGSDEENMPV